MTNKYVKSLSEYDEVEFDEVAVKKAQKISKEVLTSVSLHFETLEEIMALANKKDIPYQVLIRNFIIEGLESMKKTY
jgi:predicted DNA binding CopG/RHH family protein